MKIFNETPFAVEAIPMKLAKDTVLVVIIKGTFSILSDNKIEIAQEQIPIFFGDELEKGGSIRFESDMVPFKPRSDVVLAGKAHSTNHNPVSRLWVSFRVGNIRKNICVFGDRIWMESGLLGGIKSTDPKPFTEMDLIYERAFGGIDKEGGAVCEENPVGLGYFAKKAKKKNIIGKPLPNLEDPDNLIKNWADKPKPMGLGFIGKGWKPRISFLGTYDRRWQQERAPELPDDFSYDYYNGAPFDQQVKNYLRGDEDVELVNLDPSGKLNFNLKTIDLKVTVNKSGEFEKNDNMEELKINLDTLYLIPEEKRYYQVWRGSSLIENINAVEVKDINICI
jgi:hypothetical protein